MRVGIFGAGDDPQCEAVAREVRALGAEEVLLRYDALEQGLPISVLDGRTLYRGLDVEDLEAFYVRTVPAPDAPAFERGGELVLYDDWFVRSMQSRERASFYVAWLLALQHRGRRLVNPPQAGSLSQFKPFQLQVLRRCGARVPRTLISNDPETIRAFREEVKDVIYKPLCGGALTRTLDEPTLAQLHQVRAAPVIFQERIAGEDLRVMLAGEEVISSVAVETPEQHLDFRDDPVYARGDASYSERPLPTPVLELCRRAARECGLLFAGIDLKRTPSGEYVFLELNSSPIYLDVELKLGHPISAAIARLVVAGPSAVSRS